jgi:hypothetical protein
MRTGITRISKKEFYLLGGFANPRLFRRHRYGWRHFLDNRR